MSIYEMSGGETDVKPYKVLNENTGQYYTKYEEINSHHMWFVGVLIGAISGMVGMICWLVERGYN